VSSKKGEGGGGRPTTIRINSTTHDKLAQLGHWGETLDDIVNRLIEEHYELERLKEKR
jgi:hypothetical protein